MVGNGYSPKIVCVIKTRCKDTAFFRINKYFTHFFSLYLKNHRGFLPPVTFIYFCKNIVFLQLSLCLTAKCSQ